MIINDKKTFVTTLLLCYGRSVKKVLIFDFDGTIADSLDAIVHIMNKYAKHYGFSRITEEKRDQMRHETSQSILSNFRMSPIRLFLLATRVKSEMKGELTDIKLIPGIKKAVEELHEAGYTLGIATSNSKSTVELFLQNHKIECFDFVYGRTAFSKASMLKKIMRKYRFDKNDVTYVGDETRDIDAARAAGIKVISVAWGMHSQEILRAHTPDHLITEPQSIKRVL